MLARASFNPISKQVIVRNYEVDHGCRVPLAFRIRRLRTTGCSVFLTPIDMKIISQLFSCKSSFIETTWRHAEGAKQLLTDDCIAMTAMCTPPPPPPAHPSSGRTTRGKEEDAPPTSKPHFLLCDIRGPASRKVSSYNDACIPRVSSGGLGCVTRARGRTQPSLRIFAVLPLPVSRNARNLIS